MLQEILDETDSNQLSTGLDTVRNKLAQYKRPRRARVVTGERPPRRQKASRTREEYIQHTYHPQHHTIHHHHHNNRMVVLLNTNQQNKTQMSTF